MEITYNFGVITVDEFAFNETRLAGVLESIFNKIIITGEYTYTPCEIIFHRCSFKGTSFTLYDEDSITLNNDNLIYYFNKTVSKFFGEYLVNLTIKFEFCDYFMCAWGFEMYPSYIPIYNKDHVKLANIGVFIESNKLKFHDNDRIPSYPASIGDGYKLLCKNISSHIKRYYLCRLSIPRDAVAIATISGEVRSNKVHVDRIRTLVEVNSYNYSPEVINFIDMIDVDFVDHTSFAGKINNIITYRVGEDIIRDEIELSSYTSTGPGIYMFKDVSDAVRYLNRVVSKECNILEEDNGRVKLLSTKLLSINDTHKIKNNNSIPIIHGEK